MILKELIRTTVEKYGNKVAELGWEKKYTFAEINARTNRLANALLGIGMSKGDRLAIISNNCPQYREVYLAAAKTGMVFVPLNHRFKEAEISHIISDCAPKTIITQENFAEFIDHICSKLTSVKNLICLGQCPAKMIDYESLLSTYPSDEPSVNVSEEDLALIQYSSGTTGVLKGAMLTQKNVSAAVATRIPANGPDIVYLATFPFSSSAGYMSDLRYFLSGAAIVTREKFDAREALKDIEKYRITHINMVPTVIKFILDDPSFGQTDLSSLREVSYTSAPMPPDLLKRAMETLPHVSFTQPYGSTETVGIAELTKEDHTVLDEKGLQRLKSVGKKHPDVQVKLVDENGREVATGQEGEIVVKSDHVMKGYWGLSEATAKVLKDGWYYTGDMGVFDEEGYLYLRGRKDFMIISGGYNIYPPEIENAIASHPGVSEVAVIGVPDPEWGESVKAFIVLKEGAQVTEEEIIQLCKDKLASYKKPKSVEFLESFPKTATGKIIKKELQAKYGRAAGKQA